MMHNRMVREDHHTRRNRLVLENTAWTGIIKGIKDAYLAWDMDGAPAVEEDSAKHAPLKVYGLHGA